jgi:hypothetical protein
MRGCGAVQLFVWTAPCLVCVLPGGLCRSQNSMQNGRQFHALHQKKSSSTLPPCNEVYREWKGLRLILRAVSRNRGGHRM